MNYNLNSGFGQVVGQLPFSGSGKVFVVGDSGTANLSMLTQLFGYDPDGTLRFFSTIDAAIGACTASAGDIIYVMPGHAETVTAASGITLDVAGVSIIGLGVGNNRPIITFSSSTAASFDVTASNCAVKNIIGLAGIDGLTKPFLVSGDNCEIDIEWQDASSTVEAATVIRLDTANNSKVKLKYLGFTAGNAAVRVIAVDDCDNVQIDIDAYGVVSTAWVNFVDVASTNVSVRGRLYTSGVTNFSRLVVDTITASTWDAIIYDASAGVTVEGGSAAALAASDAASIASSVAAVGLVADAALADTIEGAAASTQSLVTDLKGVLQRIGADNANNTAATTLVAANADGSLFERAEYIQTDLLALPRCVEKSDGAVLSGSDDLFTISGGPIKILEITGIVTTTIGAGTTNVKLQITTTEPAATVDMSAAAVDIDADAAGTSYQTINTTGIFTPVTAGYVKEANSFATLPTTFLAPIGTIKFNSDAARAGVIKWYLRYVPLSPNSRVVAAA